MASIPLTKGYSAIVDNEDVEWLSQWRWRAQVSMRNGKLHRVVAVSTINGNTTQMHRFVMHTPTGMDTDHINHNTLDNRRVNLRICSPQQNQFNKKPEGKGRSKYKGVSWTTNRQKWCARIRVRNKKKHIGYFTDEIEAARAYDAAARHEYGEFAATNFEGTERLDVIASRIVKPPLSSYPGVTWHERDKRWRAQIRINGKRLWLGGFVNERDAAQAYEAAARQYRGG
jgi:hypothetical protein